MGTAVFSYGNPSKVKAVDIPICNSDEFGYRIPWPMGHPWVNGLTQIYQM